MKVFLAIAVLLATALTAAAAEAPIPVDVQLALFTKIWKLDRNFADDGEVTVAILYQESHRPSAAVNAAILSWARTAPHVRFVQVAIDEVPSMSELLSTLNVDVFYVTPMRGIDVAAIARVARTRHIRTITGVPDYVYQGIAVGLGVRNDRPLIMINVAAARAEGSAFQAQLLQLALLVNR